MKVAVVFPGQGSQFKGMGYDLKDIPETTRIFEKAKEILGFDIYDIMCNGSEEELRQTRITQPAVFLYSVCLIHKYKDWLYNHAVATAGHSLGEITALYFAQVIDFESALTIVRERALAIQEASEINPSTMAAVITHNTNEVREVCQKVSADGELVVPANFNSPSQIVISGTIKGVESAIALLKQKGIRAVPIKVGGGFHSPLMEPAVPRMQKIIDQTSFAPPIMPVYCNVSGSPSMDPIHLKNNLIAQITSPVLWDQTISAMLASGITHFVEVGPGKVLSNLISKSYPDARVIELSQLSSIITS